MNTIKKLRRRMTLLVSAVLILVTAGIVFMINYMNWRNIASQAESALETLADNSGTRPGLPNESGEAPAGMEAMSEGEGTPPEPPAKPEGQDGVWEDASEGAPGEEPGQNPMQGQESGRTFTQGAAADQNMPQGMPPDQNPAMGQNPAQGPAPGQNPAPGGEDKPETGQPPQIRDALATLSNYYVVTLAEDGGVAEWTSDRAYLYSDDQVRDMTQLVLTSGAQSGHIGSQFFTISKQKDTDLLIVLDERLEVMAAQRVLRTSSLIAAVACMLLCVCAWFLIRFMVRPVQDAFERQRQFVWDASHELKTPLAVIGANAQALEGEIGANEALSYITDEVQRTNRMIQNLLTLAKTDQSGTKMQLTQVNLGDAVLSAVLPLESSAFDEGKTIETQIEESVFCRGDEDMLRQLTVILLSNAIKYSDNGSEIVVSVQKRGKGAVLSVRNIGDGIAPRDMEQIFDRFYRVDSSHSRIVEGHGLGLSIARNIVQLHKGNISVSSEPDANGRYRTTFTVTL